MDPKALQNKANQNNPNNSLYWQSRGYSSKPETWKDEVHRKMNHFKYFLDCSKISLA